MSPVRHTGITISLKDEWQYTVFIGELVTNTSCRDFGSNN